MAKTMAEFTAYFSYQGGPFGQVTVESELEFDSYSFQGTVEITQTLDSEFAALKFGPSMQFNKTSNLILLLRDWIYQM